MKILILASAFALASLVITSAAKAEATNFAAAFPRSEKWADPGTFSFKDEGDTTYLTLARGDLHVRIAVTMRVSPQSREGYEEKTFDGVYLAEDRLSSVTVTGSFSDEGGFGTIAIHKSADARNPSGKIELSSFVLSRLKTGESEDATKSTQ